MFSMLALIITDQDQVKDKCPTTEKKFKNKEGMHADSVTIEDKHTDYINSKGHLWSLIRKR